MEMVQTHIVWMCRAKPQENYATMASLRAEM